MSSLRVSEITQTYQQIEKVKNEESDEVAEWLRRWTAKPMCSARVGSNPILVVSIIYIFNESNAYAKRYAKSGKYSVFVVLVAQNVFQTRILKMTAPLQVN